MREERKEQEETIRGWFTEHRATFSFSPAADPAGWPIHTLIWAKPESGHYAIRYVIMGPVLMVWGDLECAVYRWSQAITWEFIASCDLQYFESKCEASPMGRDYRDYDSRRALFDFDETIKRRAEEGYDHPDPRLVEDARLAIRYGSDEWHEWMRTDGHRLFGHDWYEWVPDLGKEIAQTCHAHLLGIKIALAQLKQQQQAAA